MPLRSQQKGDTGAFNPLQAPATGSEWKCYPLCCSFFEIQPAFLVAAHRKAFLGDYSHELLINVRKQIDRTIIFQIIFIAVFVQQNGFFQPMMRMVSSSD